eukprot:COSAG04_NODE_1847_length_5412_cov_9.729155_2_plen_130_part_00
MLLLLSLSSGCKRRLRERCGSNGCGCIETREPASGWQTNYAGDIGLLHEMGWDGVKFDGCGSQCNMSDYAALMNETGKAYEIENCRELRAPASFPHPPIAMTASVVWVADWGDCTEDDASSCPTKDWCP